MPRAVRVAAIVLMTATAAPAGAGEVRTMSPALTTVIETGLSRSPAFRALFDRIEDSDVIVYVRDEHASMGALHGSLTFVSKAGGLRYVLVRLASRARMRHVAILGHELQHAVEIAQRPEIVDQASLVRAYAQFGMVVHRRPRDAGRKVDTHAAIRMEQRIWRELAQFHGANARSAPSRD